MSCATEGATIRYTLNGTEPNSHSTKYTGPFYVTDTCTVKAYAVMTDYLNFSVATQEIVKVWGIGDSLGKPDHGFTTHGDGAAGWESEVDSGAPNGGEMISGAIRDGQTSVLETMVMGPGTLIFSWRTSCEEAPDGKFEWDHVEFAVDGVVLLKLDGKTPGRPNRCALKAESSTRSLGHTRRMTLMARGRMPRRWRDTDGCRTSPRRRRRMRMCRMRGCPDTTPR
ncbi:MAG: chitobiase/beta-hexosaminidase C-terminal domain-containing protein [Kiritimatiellae bacterium]|nr:chitobiase/beta-hexosaminidase C-terminal domain-containing protein [Kiritimatiellia bacterium]